MPYISEEQKEFLEYTNYRLAQLLAELNCPAADARDGNVFYPEKFKKFDEQINSRRCGDNVVLQFQKDGGLSSQKEKSLLIDIKGVSMNTHKRKDGRFQGYVSQDGVRVYFYGKSTEELSQKISTYLKSDKPKKIKKDTNKSPLLSDWLDKWLTLYKKPNVKPLTFQSLLYSAKPLLNTFGNKRLNELSADMLQAFFIALPSQRTRELAVMVLNQSLEKARKQGIIKYNPCEALEFKTREKKHKSALTREEQSILIEVVKGKTIEAIFWLMLTTGLRVGEALALTSSDVDFIKQTVSVSKNVVFIKGKRILQDTPKTSAGVRTVPTPEKTLAFLKGKTGDLFPVTYNSVRLGFKRLAETTGINVSAHILRHTYATRLEEAGISPKVKQYLLGHSKIEVTQNTYTDIQKGYIDTLSGKIKGVFD